MADKSPLVVDYSVSPAIVREMEPDETVPTENALPTGGTAGQVLTKDSNVQGDASWQDPPAGSGDLVGPNASTDQAIVAFSGTTGKLAQNTPSKVNPSTGSITLPSGATVDGVDVSTLPGLITAGDAAGAAALAAHVGTGGTAHASATEAAKGFLDPADKTQLVDLARVRELLASATKMVAPDDRNTVDVLWVIGQNRWRCGTPTIEPATPFATFVAAYFYAEMPASLSATLPGLWDATHNIALYSPIGVPNSGSPNSNAAANTEALVNASMYWDEGIPIPPNAFVGGAMLEADLFGQIKIGRAGTLYLVIDPDGDVRIQETGDNATLASERHKCIGGDSATQIAEYGLVEDNGSGKVLIRLSSHGLSNGDLVWISTADRTRGIMPDLIDGGYYYVSSVTTDTFLPSSVNPTPGPAVLITYTGPGAPPPDGETDEVIITRSTSSGSRKQVKLAFTLTTNTSNSDFVPVHIRIVGCADGRGALDTEDGVLWFVTMETFEVSDRIGTTATATTVAVTEGATASKVWRAAAARSGPGKGFQTGSGIWPTGAPMALASTDYSGTGTDSYYTTAHDYAGQWDEVMLTADVTASVPFKSITSSVNNVEATATLLSVGGTPVGHVYELSNARRLLRYRPFTEEVRIKNGDTVSYQVYRLVSGTWSAVSGASGSFTAGAVRLGPQTTKLSIRAAMDGAQDSTNVLDIRGGTARLTRNRRR